MKYGFFILEVEFLGFVNKSSSILISESSV